MQRGACKWFNGKKGYGFVTADDGMELFIHVLDLAPGVFTLAEGQRLEFEVTTTPKGPRARDVRTI